jgi:uncharacterized protein YjbI with pentapeptide repeats
VGGTPEHVELANQGAAAIAKWRASHPYRDEERGPGLNLSGAELGGRNLEGADLRRALLQETNFGSREWNPNALSSLTPYRNEQLEWAEEASMVTNLRRADLAGAWLHDANLVRADLREANLTKALAPNTDFRSAHLECATLTKAELSGANLKELYLVRANLRGARLIGADLRGAILCDADLTEADLSAAILTEADLDRAVLRRSRVYGAAVWDIKGAPADERDLIITRDGEAPLTVDKLELAQLLYLINEQQEATRSYRHHYLKGCADTWTLHRGT